MQAILAVHCWRSYPNEVLHTTLEPTTRTLAHSFPTELHENHDVSDAVFPVDGMGYMTTPARTEQKGRLDRSDRIIVEELF